MGTFIESCQEGVKNVVQESWFFPDVGYPLKIARCWDHALYDCLNKNLLYLPLSLKYSLSLCLSLLHSLSNYSVPRIPGVILVELSDPGESSSLYPLFSFMVQSSNQTKIVVQKQFFCMNIHIFKHGTSYPNSSHCQPFTITFWQLNVYCSIPNLIQRSTHFKTHSHKDSRKY